MTVTRHDYAGNAPDTALTTGINASALSIVIADATGWPTGTNGPFVIDIDNGLSAYEKVLIDSRAGTTLTVNASGRGWDDTSGATHAIDAVVRHVLSAAEIEELNAHASNEAHPHTAAGLGTDSVTTVKILDANVTLAKMAANSVDSDQYVDGSIDLVHLATEVTDDIEGEWGAITSAALTAVSTNTETALTLGTVLGGSQAGITSTANRLTAKTAGVFEVSAHMAANSGPSADDKVISLYVRKNGTAFAYARDNKVTGAAAYLSLTVPITLAVDDYIDIACFHGYGTNLNVGGSAATDQNRLSFRRLGA